MHNCNLCKLWVWLPIALQICVQHPRSAHKALAQLAAALLRCNTFCCSDHTWATKPRISLLVPSSLNNQDTHHHRTNCPFAIHLWGRVKGSPIKKILCVWELPNNKTQRSSSGNENSAYLIDADSCISSRNHIQISQFQKKGWLATSSSRWSLLFSSAQSSGRLVG